MTGFSADWLALREPFDLAARAASGQALGLHTLASRLRSRADAGLRLLDLACGTGANLRALAPRLGGAQQWLLVDHDPALLAALPQHFTDWAMAHGHAWQAVGDGGRLEGTGWQAHLAFRQADLATGLDALPFDAVHLVTASALLDLVSAPWLDALLARALGARNALLLALTVDGRVCWTEEDADDARIHALFSAHQCRDKGFGPALGGHAVPQLLARLDALGCTLSHERSDWFIDAASHPMLRAMIDGMADAALAQDPSARAAVLAWQARRLAAIGRTGLRVGHVDVLALPV